MSESAKKTRETNKTKKVADQEATRVQRLLDEKLKKLKSSPLPEPRYSYRVGQKALPRSANWDYLVIREVLDNGKILLCDIHSSKTKGDKKDFSQNQSYVSHLDIIPESLALAPNMSKRDHRSISFQNGEVYGLLLQHYNNDIDYSPIYQRELCWTEENKQQLIHSIFNNVEIGKFAFISLPFTDNGPAVEILDGKQRLSTLIEFYEDKFQYNGLYFSQLSRTDKMHFERYPATVGTSREESWTLPEKMQYFLKLNVQGVPQSLDHLNKVEKMLKNAIKMAKGE
jgi:hypothetical protein